MFTGIISDIGSITEIHKMDRGMRCTISTPYAAENMKIGDSIACSGICLTTTDISLLSDGCIFNTDVSNETINKTNCNTWIKGTSINLELSLKPNDALGGHFVTGHVDGLAQLVDVEEIGNGHRLTLQAPENLQFLIAQKGSVTLDGVSLTVNAVDKARFEVMLIPHTWNMTTFHQRKVGDVVNLEVDILARYIARQMEQFRA